MQSIFVLWHTQFVLWHTHGFDGDSDEKLIGAYENRKDASAAICRLSDKPGFRDSPDGFEIVAYILGEDHWSEGFIPQAHALQEKDS